MSAALDSGLAFATIIIFLSLGMQNINAPSWWGTTFFDTTADAEGKGPVRIKLAKGETFGPSTWD